MRYLLLLLITTLVLAPCVVSADPLAKTATTAPAAIVAAPTASLAVSSDLAKPLSVTASPATKEPASTPAKLKPNRTITVGVFLIIILATLVVVYWAARRTKTASDFYAAGGGISGVQNGWAIAGDYMSAAMFLGLTGLVSIFGIDGALYSVGPLISFITILLIIAEPLRNAGKYTMGDILCFRSPSKVVRSASAISTVTLSIFYLLTQMVGAGKLIQLLLGIPFKTAVVGVGVLITIYVVFGGMKATTWVQIIKAVLLLAAGVVLGSIVLWKSGMNMVQLFNDVANFQAVQDHVRGLLKHPVAEPGFDYGQRFLEAGLFLKDPLDQISMGFAMVFGAAGLPHIMMRFFTVPNAKAARKSVVIAMFIIGIFLVMVTIMGLGAALYVTPQNIMAVDKGGNMAALLLAQTFGGGVGSVGGDLFLAIVCAVAFSTILAVVSGLVLASSAAIAHDIYVTVIKDGKADQKEQVKVARISSLVIGVVAVGLGVTCENANVAQLVTLAFAIAASSNLPVIVFSLFWKRFNTAGIISGLVVGSVSAIGLMLVSPNMVYPKKIAGDAKKIVSVLEKKQLEGVALVEKDLKTLEKARSDYAKNKDGKSIIGLDAPLFPLKNPGIVTVPLGFLAAIIGCLAFRDRRSEETFDELYVRQNTGAGMETAIDH